MLVFDRAGVEGGSLSQVWTMHNMLLVSIFFVTTYVVCVDSELHVSNALARCDSNNSPRRKRRDIRISVGNTWYLSVDCR